MANESINETDRSDASIRRSAPTVAVGSLAAPAERVEGSCSCAEAQGLFDGNPELQSVVVALSDGGFALLSRQHLSALVAHRSTDFLDNNSIESIMDPVGSFVVESGDSVEKACRAVLAQMDLAFAKELIVTGPGGVSTIMLTDLLNELMGSADRFEQALRSNVLPSSEQRFRSLVQNASDVVIVVDSEGRIEYVSPAVRQVMGYSPDDELGKGVLDYVHPDHLADVGERFVEVASEPGRSTRMELRARHHDGSWRWVDATATNLLHDRAVGGLVINYRDITDRKALEEQLRHQAFHDPLTGLANRALLKDRIDHALSHRREGTSVSAVMLMDIDDFKLLNDSLGHEAGDSALAAVAGRLSDVLRPADTAARLGGDEFAIFVEDISSPDEAVRIGERVLTAVQKPLELGNRRLSLRSSLGVALAEPGKQASDELLRNADVAMYRAKSQYRGGLALYESAMHAEVLHRLQVIEDLQVARGRGQLLLHYQPIVALARDEIVGFEALIRWNHPTRGMVPPLAFIPAAEDTGLIIEIGEWVLGEACRQARAWQLLDDWTSLGISVNLSPKQFERSDIVGTVGAALEDSGLAPADLTLEITEGLLVADTHVSLSKLAALKDLGVRLAIDDFGTGYSSLSYLHRFPIDQLKIDKSFVDHVAQYGDGSTLARAVIGLGEVLGVGTVGEGIETREQVWMLVGLGCELGQGYYFSRPLPAQEAQALLGRKFQVAANPL
jgi:diguanylate cyclase (GGDEF)-like protein/PAS domain S-box-containing protein